jgi:hypothetical protein
MRGYVRNRYTQSVLDAIENTEPKYVFIDEGKLLEVREEISQMDLGHNDWRGPVFPEEDGDRFIAFLVVSGAINFCFTDFTTDKSFDVEYPGGKIQKGAFAMFAALMRAMEEGIDVLNPRVLAEITHEEVRHIFRHVKTPMPMIEERTRNLVNLGRSFRSKRMDFADIFRKNGFRALHSSGGGGIVPDLARMACYNDESIFNEHRVLFYKRAQLVPMMYHGRALSSGGALPLLEDPENIGPIADYRVPQALRHRGVIYYAKGLADFVNNGIVIFRHDEEEIEIRAIGVIQAMDRLIMEVNKRRPADKQIVMGQLDYPVWKMGRNAEGRHHYTYTTAY